jgi:hypothetical protein
MKNTIRLFVISLIALFATLTAAAQVAVPTTGGPAKGQVIRKVNTAASTTGLFCDTFTRQPLARLEVIMNSQYFGSSVELRDVAGRHNYMGHPLNAQQLRDLGLGAHNDVITPTQAVAGFSIINNGEAHFWRKGAGGVNPGVGFQQIGADYFDFVRGDHMFIGLRGDAAVPHETFAYAVRESDKAVFLLFWLVYEERDNRIVPIEVKYVSSNIQLWTGKREFVGFGQQLRTGDFITTNNHTKSMVDFSQLTWFWEGNHSSLEPIATNGRDRWAIDYVVKTDSITDGDRAMYIAFGDYSVDRREVMYNGMGGTWFGGLAIGDGRSVLYSTNLR